MCDGVEEDIEPSTYFKSARFYEVVRLEVGRYNGRCTVVVKCEVRSIILN